MRSLPLVSCCPVYCVGQGMGKQAEANRALAVCAAGPGQQRRLQPGPGQLGPGQPGGHPCLPFGVQHVQVLSTANAAEGSLHAFEAGLVVFNSKTAS